VRFSPSGLRGVDLGSLRGEGDPFVFRTRTGPPLKHFISLRKGRGRVFSLTSPLIRPIELRFFPSSQDYSLETGFTQIIRSAVIDEHDIINIFNDMRAMNC
jgi:hypothetical protein